MKNTLVVLACLVGVIALVSAEDPPASLRNSLRNAPEDTLRKSGDLLALSIREDVREELELSDEQIRALEDGRKVFIKIRLFFSYRITVLLKWDWWGRVLMRFGNLLSFRLMRVVWI